MGEKDKAEKTLEDYNDVFADIVNVLILKKRTYRQAQPPPPIRRTVRCTVKTAIRPNIRTMVL